MTEKLDNQRGPPQINLIESESVCLVIPDVDDNRLSTLSVIKKSSSMTSLRAKLRQKRERFQKNQCAGIILFLIFGSIFNVLAYLASVWSAQLNADLIKSAVENEHAFRFKLKKKLLDEPSKFLIGLLNFGGRVLSAIGTIMIIQVLTTYLKRRRYNVIVKSAAEEADTVLSDMHGGITDTAGECCLACFQSLS